MLDLRSRPTFTHNGGSTMKTIEASTTTVRKPMTKSQRVRELNGALEAVRDQLAEVLEDMIGLGNGPFELGELAMTAECRSEMRARLDAGKGPAEFRKLGRRFVELDDLLHGPESRQAELHFWRVHLELLEAKYRGKSEAERKQMWEDSNESSEERQKIWFAKVRKEVNRRERQAARASKEKKAA